ncbi:MAG: hypothetical protein WA667_27110 [Candidatus Nitrosopolaris sp.]
MGIPRTVDDIAVISNIKRKSIAKCYRQIIFELDLKLPIIDSTKCIARVANKVNISERTKHRAIDLKGKTRIYKKKPVRIFGRT